MRYRLIPPATAEIDAILEAVPQTAAAVDDCCAHLVTETSVEDRETAQSWLVFLQALGLVDENEDGYFRTSASPGTEELQAAFRERVFGVEEVLDELAEARESRAVEDVAASATSRFPASRDWEVYVVRLLAWAERFDLVRESAGGYKLVAQP